MNIYSSWQALKIEPYRYGYQGQFAEQDEETGWTAFDLRMYDATLGRWLQTDPYSQFPSPYLGMGNNPVNSTDPDGGFSFVGAFVGALIGCYAGGVVASGEWNPRKWSGNDWTWAAVGSAGNN